MDYFRRFNFLLCAPSFDPDELEGTRLDQIVLAVGKSGFEVTRARRVEDAELAIKTDAAIGCMIVDWGKKGMNSKTAGLISYVRKRGLEMPIILLVRRKRLKTFPSTCSTMSTATFSSPRKPPNSSPKIWCRGSSNMRKP